jgi:two-component system nitrogen regulation response regulator GlnG
LAVQEGGFRQDLYFRLNVAAIDLPALRARREDIPELARYFLQRYGAELGSSNPVMTTDAIDVLEQQPWPGNVRQLRNVVRKALLLARGYAIGPEVIREALAQMVPPRPAVDQTFDEYISELLARARSEELKTSVRLSLRRSIANSTPKRFNGRTATKARLPAGWASRAQPCWKN